MKPYQANLVNAAVLILLGIWGYFETKAGTAFIPIGFGVLFLLATAPFKNDNKVVAHIIVLLTLVLIVMLFAKPLRSAIDEDRQMAIIRIGIMILTGIFAMVVYIKNFIAVRNAEES